MFRFFVEKKENNKFILTKEILNHIKVIRLKNDEKFYCIFEKNYYLCHLENDYAIIERKIEIDHEYKNSLILFAPIINIKNFEWLIQKAAELGVQKLYPLITFYTNKKNIEVVIKKLERFKEIAKNACEQSFRNQIMTIEKPIQFEDAINLNIEQKIIAHEKIESTKELISFNIEKDLAFFIGPEGGFSDDEINLATTKKIQVVSLGKRILRSETAAIFLLSRIR